MPGLIRSESKTHDVLITRNTTVVDVVIDPDLSSLMRTHQHEGVKVSDSIEEAH